MLYVNYTMHQIALTQTSSVLLEVKVRIDNAPVCRHACLQRREGQGEPGSRSSPRSRPPAWRPVQFPTRLCRASKIQNILALFYHDFCDSSLFANIPPYVH